MINATLTQIPELENWCYAAFTYTKTYNMTEAECTEIVPYTGFPVYNLFFAGFMLNFSEPDPAQGAQSIAISLNLNDLTSIENVEAIYNIEVAIGRDPKGQDLNTAD